jgi:acetyltransferase-like isoleucine patch superfamily enzyme
MNLLSKILRLFSRKLAALFSLLRVVRLRLLYPGITIDFTTHIEKNCSIVCIKGGRLVISRSHISYGTSIVADERSFLSIDGTFIGRNCVITAKEKVIIHPQCLIAEMVVIRDQDHHIEFKNGHSQREAFKTAPIEIGEHVWVAAKATILKGVQIGQYSVIAASAVVTKSVPSHQVWGGIPATFIKEITRSD